MNYLPKEDYVPYAPDIEGEQVHVNHTNCPAGTDTKQRLYIKRNEHGILAYCHHCNERGFQPDTHIPDIRTLRKRQKDKAGVGESRGGYNTTLDLPRDFSTDIGEWPVKARAWLYKASLTDGDISYARIGFSKSLSRIVLPVYLPSGVGLYQTRRIFEQDTGPKYLTVGNTKSVCCVYSRCSGSALDNVVVVEDILSGIRVSKYASALVLLGSSLHDRHIEHILSSGYKKCLIYLDNDNPKIVLSAVKMRLKLDMILDNVATCDVKGDPKNKSDKELQAILSHYF